MSEKVDAATRLFNLTCALLYTREGLSRDQIFSRVSGYSQDYKPGKNSSALIKLFERDKLALSAAGIPWISFQPPSAMEDNQEWYYKVPKQEFLWPKNLILTPKQIGLLNLASTVWSQAALSREAASAALRIKGLGERAEVSDLAALAPRIRTHHPSFAKLTEAIERGIEVSFGYRKPTSSEVEKRKFRPWQLHNISGQWLVIGFDLVREEPRSFLLRRIITDVALLPGEANRPSKTELDKANASLEAFIESNLVTLRVKPETEAWFRFELDDVAHEKPDEVSFHFMDAHLLADDLRQYAGDIEVIRPVALREIIEAGFERVVELHHG